MRGHARPFALGTMRSNHRGCFRVQHSQPPSCCGVAGAAWYDRARGDTKRDPSHFKSRLRVTRGSAGPSDTSGPSVQTKQCKFTWFFFAMSHLLCSPLPSASFTTFSFQLSSFVVFAAFAAALCCDIFFLAAALALAFSLGVSSVGGLRTEVSGASSHPGSPTPAETGPARSYSGASAPQELPTRPVTSISPSLHTKSVHSMIPSLPSPSASAASNSSLKVALQSVSLSSHAQL